MPAGQVGRSRKAGRNGGNATRVFEARSIEARSIGALFVEANEEAELHRVTRALRSRVLPLAGALAVGALAAALAVSLGGSILSVILAAAGGGVVGGLVGQGAAWARASAGSARRIEWAMERMFDSVGHESRRTRETVTSSIDRLRRDQTEAEKSRHASTVKTITDTTRRQLDDQVALLEAYVQLQRLVPLSAPMPRAGTWAASEDFLLWLVGHVLHAEPRTIVDLGSGQSSVWMAAALRQAGVPGRVVAVDHDEVYAEQTRQLAREHGVSRWLEVRLAPLVPVTVEGRTSEWYDPSVFEDLEHIDVLSVDGPPGAGREQARWPALPVLKDRLAPGARVVLDDLIRRDEQEIVADWTQRYPQIGVERLDFEKGAAVLVLPRDGVLG